MKRENPRVWVRWSEIFVCAAIGLGPLSFACSSSAQLAPGRFVIEASQVVDAMGEGRLPTEGLQVQLASPVTASVPAARIEVASVSPLRPHEVRLRLVCSQHSECLPFFATATYPDAVDVSTIYSGRGSKVTADRLLQPQNGNTVAAAAPVVKTAGTLRAGSKAMLEFEAERIHIRIEVITLQSGVSGSRIRVSSVDHKQTYMAEVITPTLLKGEIAK